MIGSGVGGIELVIDRFLKKGNRPTDRQTDRQTLLWRCEDASKNDWEWCGRDLIGD